MTKLKHAILFFLLLAGCQAEFIEAPEYDNALVVNGMFSYDTLCFFNVSYLEDVLKVDSNTFENAARLTLTDPSGREYRIPHSDTVLNRFDSLWQHNRGYYRLEEPLPYMPGMYKLSVEVSGHPPLYAFDSIPRPVRIEAHSVASWSMNRPVLIVRMYEPGNLDNFYALSVTETIYLKYSDDVTEKDISHDFHTEAPFIEGYIPYGDGYFFSDRMINGKIQQVELKVCEFCGCNISRYLEQDGNDFVLNSQAAHIDSFVVRVYLHSLSRSYYNYASDCYKQLIAEQDFYAEPVSVFSNIAGGYGIFAGYSTSTASFVFKHKHAK